MKKVLFLLLFMTILLNAGVSSADSVFFNYRFLDAEEAAEMLLSNRAYYENMSQNDLNFRMQKTDASLEEMETFAAGQTRDFSDTEKAAVDEAMAEIEKICRERGYALPAADTIMFAKTTMREECGAAAYTHGTQIYLGETFLYTGLSDEPKTVQQFRRTIAHELFHCLTRNHPDFRRTMYGILGFTVAEEDFSLPKNIRDRIISNPDVEHHDSYASFEIGGEMKDCVVIFTTSRPFEQPGDSFFSGMITGLVPIDDLSVMYTSDDAANFWDVFGKNTSYVIDPEETMADNFSFLIIRGTDTASYKTPEIIEAIDSYLKYGDASRNLL